MSVLEGLAQTGRAEVPRLRRGLPAAAQEEDWHGQDASSASGSSAPISKAALAGLGFPVGCGIES